MMVQRFKSAICILGCVVGFGLQVAKIPGELDAKWKLPPQVEAVADVFDGMAYLRSMPATAGQADEGILKKP